MKTTIAENFLKNKSIGCPFEQPKYFEWVSADDQAARFVTDSFIKSAKGEGQIAWLLEPFSLHPEDYTSAMKKPFDAVLTHNLYFANINNWLWYPRGGSWIDREYWGAHKKSRNISILMSQKNTMTGHKFRHRIVEKLSGKIDDVFGLEKWIAPLDALAAYRYSVVVENEKSSYWFTEKLLNCLLVGTIPIYWGCPGICNFFNTDGFLLVDTLDDVQDAIGIANQKYYKSHQKTITENIEIAKKYVVCEDWIFENYRHLFGDELCVF